MSWLRRIFGTDFPDPVVGQVWKCTRNGEFMRVSDVHVHTSGTVFVSVANWGDGKSWARPEGWGMGDHYALGIGHWRRQLKNERRVFMGIEFDPKEPS